MVVFFSLFFSLRVKDAAQPHHYAHVRPSEAVKMAAPCVMCTGLSNICTELQRWDAYMWATFFFFWVKWNQSHFSAGFVSSNKQKYFNPFLHEQAEVFAFAQTASKEPDRVLDMGVRCGASHCSVKHWGVRHNTNYFGRRLLTIAWAYSFWRCTPSFSQTHKARGM